MITRAVFTCAVCFMFIADTSQAEVCDYTPSSLVGKSVTAIGTAVAGGSAAAGVGLQAAGYYTLVHAGSGLTMLASTAAGTSAAGTVGIIAGTGGLVGTVSAVLMAPVTIVLGGITIVGVGLFEGACYFQVERVTDPYEVRRLIESIASRDDAVSIIPTDDGDAMALTVLGNVKTYLLRKLYIADGHLKYRDFGPNTNLGPILFTAAGVEE
ncbi:hypothetical protein [Primorskyibacter flagellatus]|uniref:hypothetical protein n=1 Tax=Primorskyibacter flagellatus TaxID=1387277 RepID=UPI003A912E37